MRAAILCALFDILPWADAKSDAEKFFFNVDNIESYEGLPPKLKRQMDQLLRIQACVGSNSKSCDVKTKELICQTLETQNKHNLPTKFGCKSEKKLLSALWLWRSNAINAARKVFRDKLCAIPRRHRLAAKRIVELTWAESLRAGPSQNKDKNTSKLPGLVTASWLLQGQDPCKNRTKGLKKQDLVIMSDIDDTMHYSSRPEGKKWTDFLKNFGKKMKGKIAGNDFRPNEFLPSKSDSSNFLAKEAWINRFVPTFFNTLAGKTGWLTASSARPFLLMDYEWSQGFRSASTKLWTWKKRTNFVKEGADHVAVGVQPGHDGQFINSTLSIAHNNFFNYTQHTSYKAVEDQKEVFESVGNHKYNNYVAFIRSYPELAGKTVFVGDDGQGDLRAMLQMLKHKQNGKHTLLFGALKLTHLMTKKERKEKKYPQSHDLERKNYRTLPEVLEKEHADLIKEGRLFLFTSYEELAGKLRDHEKTRPYGEKILGKKNDCRSRVIKDKTSAEMTLRV